jgi:hypothetical protein
MGVATGKPEALAALAELPHRRGHVCCQSICDRPLEAWPKISEFPSPGPSRNPPIRFERAPPAATASEDKL